MGNKTQEFDNKFNVKLDIPDATGTFGSSSGYKVYGETKLRVKTKDIGGSGVVLVEGQLAGEDDWDTLATITGATEATVDISTYDLIRFNVDTDDGEGTLFSSGFFLPSGGSSGGGGVSVNEYANTAAFPTADGTNGLAWASDTNSMYYDDGAWVLIPSGSVNTASLSGLSGGGDLTTSRNLIIDASNLTTVTSLSLTDVLPIDDGTATNKKITVANSFLMYRSIWVDAAAMFADTVSGPEAVTSVTTTQRNHYDAWSFDQSTTEYVWFKFSPPTAWNGGQMRITYYWEPLSSGNVVWRNQSVALGNNEGLDSSKTTSTGVVDSALLLIGLHISPVDSVSPAGATKHDLFMIRVYRDASNASDTSAADAKLLGVKLQWLENAIPVALT